MKRTLILIFSGLILLSACDPFHTGFTVNDVKYYTSVDLNEVPLPDTLVVMTWNIKFGGARIDFFFDCYGDRVVMTEEEVIHNLEGLVRKIKQVNPDILYLQEADLESKRSAYVDQIQYLLDNTSMNYGVYASQWKADWVPSNGIGRINSGNAILSRWPLQEAKRIALPLFEDQNAIVRYFYLKRNVLMCKMEIEGEEITLLNTHLSAYSTDNTRFKQLQILDSLIKKLDQSNEIFILGGDFNSLPPGTKKVKGFPDSVCEDEFVADDYSAETEWMLPFYEFTPAISLEDYKADNEPFLSHTVNNAERGGFWNRKLDYLFTNGYFIEGSGVTHQDEKTGMNTMELSDHCPVSVKFVLN